MHTIRLGPPWQTARTDSGARHARKFGWPRALDASERLWLVVGFVVSVSVLLLAMMFRSVVVPVKAAAMNLLSIAASYGVLVAIFQWGWGGSVLG